MKYVQIIIYDNYTQREVVLADYRMNDIMHTIRSCIDRKVFFDVAYDYQMEPALPADHPDVVKTFNL